MIINITQIAVFFGAMIGLSFLLGIYMKKVYSNERTFMTKIIKPVETLLYRILRVDPLEEMNWRKYAVCLLTVNVLGIFILIFILMLQKYLPFNPQALPGMPFTLALNTAVSFVTNTNWQAYAGETTLSYFSQTAGLTVQNFASAATGMCVAVALIRGLTRKQASGIGNFWTDMVKSLLYILLPLSIILALLLAGQGVIQNLNPYQVAATVEGSKQIIPMGPVASQEAIKMLGTNGGGFFNANSAHPFENPTGFSNLLEMVAMIIIPAGLVITFEKMTGNKKQGYVIFSAMFILLLLMFLIIYITELKGNPFLAKMGISTPTSMEGKEARFGLVNSSMFSTLTTAISCGAVNAMHSSLGPLAGMAALLQIMLGEVIFGGAGAGFYSIMIFVIFTIFIVGLMVGRTPEYLGKKIEASEVKMAIIAIIIPSAFILIGSGIASVTAAGTSSILNKGPHGLTEILYAFSSAAQNNGSAFAGLNANTIFYNLSLAAAMFAGRFGVIIPVLAISGSSHPKRLFLKVQALSRQPA